MYIQVAALLGALLGGPVSIQAPPDARFELTERIELPGHKAPVLRLALFERGNWLASSDESGVVLLWNLNARQIVPKAVGTFADPVRGLAIRAGDGVIAMAPSQRFGGGKEEPKLVLMRPDIPQREPLAIPVDFEWHNWSSCLAFGPGTQPSLLAAGCEKHEVRIWKVATAIGLDDKNKRVLPVTEGVPGTGHSRVTSIAFSPDRRNPVVAVGCAQGSVQMFRVGATPVFGLTEIPGPEGHTKEVGQICFSPDGRLLATACEDGTIAIWDVGSKERLRLITSPQGKANSICFSPDGKLLASAHDDGNVGFWDPSTGEQELVHHAHDLPVLCVAFDADGDRLFTSSRDQKIKGWSFRDAQRMRNGARPRPGAPAAKARRPVRNAGDPEATPEEATSPQSQLRPGSVWASDDSRLTLTIVERDGDACKVRFQSPSSDRVITAEIKENTISWKADNVVVIRGRGPGGDNTGTINGDTIEFTYRDPDGKTGGYVLRRKSGS